MFNILACYKDAERRLGLFCSFLVVVEVELSM